MCRENTIYKNCHINLRGIKPIVKVRLRDLSFNMVYNIVYSIVSQSLPSVVENIKPEKNIPVVSASLEQEIGRVFRDEIEVFLIKFATVNEASTTDFILKVKGVVSI